MKIYVFLLFVVCCISVILGKSKRSSTSIRNIEEQPTEHIIKKLKDNYDDDVEKNSVELESDDGEVVEENEQLNSGQEDEMEAVNADPTDGFLLRKRATHYDTSKKPQCPSPNPIKPLTNNQKDVFLNIHNQLRTNVKPAATNMQKLDWDEDLAGLAQQVADTCVFQHDILYNCADDKIGQNLYLGMSFGDVKDSRIVDVVTSWNNEYKYYHADSGKCDKGRSCGHYTAIQWADTNRVGCAINDTCKITMPGYEQYGYFNLLVACDYYKAGNFIGKAAFEPGSSCTDCPEGFSCVDNLCTKD